MATTSRRAAEQQRSDVQRKTRETSSASPESTGAPPQATLQGVQAAVTNPQQASPAQLLEIQRLYGNQAVQRLLNAGAPAKPPPPQKTSESTVSRTSQPSSMAGGPLDSHTQTQIDSARGGGSPLDAGVGAQVGNALGADFSGVNVHTDPQADALNRNLSAKAFTTGSDIFFSQGAYQPGSSSGKQLLAHELTHVVQQGSAKPNLASPEQGRRVQTKRAPGVKTGVPRATKPHKLQFKLTVGAANDRYEQEADHVAAQVMNAPAVTQPAVQRHGAPEEETVARSFATVQAGRQTLQRKAEGLWLPKAKYGLFEKGAFQQIKDAVRAYNKMGGENWEALQAQEQKLLNIRFMIDAWLTSHDEKGQQEAERKSDLETLMVYVDTEKNDVGKQKDEREASLPLGQLEDPKILKLFTEFAKSEWSGQNLDAWREIMAFKEDPSLQKAQAFYDKYLVSEAYEKSQIERDYQPEINIDFSLFKTISTAIANKQITADMFDGIIKAVKLNMADTFSRFQLSKAYKEAKGIKSKPKPKK